MADATYFDSISQWKINYSQQWHFALQSVTNLRLLFCSLVVLVAEQWEKVVMFSIVEVTIFDVQSFQWLKDALIHHFQGMNSNQGFQ